ncbi:MAG: hypothetical protein WC855_09945 [Thermodesulfovibrionales bacterium]
MNILSGKYVKYFLSLFLASGVAAAADTASASTPIYQIQWQADGIVSELEINGVTVDKISSEFSGAGSAPLNIWLKPGKNIFTIRLKLFPKSDSGSFKVFLAMAQKGQYAEQGEKVFEFLWESGKSKDKLPLEKKIEFTPQSVPALELWTKTEQITLDADTEKAIRSFLKTLSDAYTKADAGKAAELQEFKVAEYSLALGGKEMSMSEMKKEIKGYFSMLKSDKAKFTPIDTDGAKLQLVAENRLVLVTAKDGKSPLIAKSESGEYVVDIYLARINGKWVVAR